MPEERTTHFATGAPGDRIAAPRTCDDPEVGRRILEREHELAALADAARAAESGAGSVALVSGEAGIGKSSLVEAARAVLPAEGRLLVGWCDDLATPRTLGPLRDLVGSVGTELTRALDDGDRVAVMEALRAELDRPGRPTVLAIEDLHWADEATLDIVRYLVRRVAALPAVLLLTYRDDELGRDHPLRHVLGLATGTPRLHRLPLARLSEEAVRRLGRSGALDPGEVFAVTAGNPFFVTEVLAGGDTAGVPPTIAAAVAGRVSGLPEETRDALEQLAVVPSALDRRLVDALVPGGLATLAPAEERGVLTVTPERVAFRHELARRAVADLTPPARRVERNRRALAALLAAPGAELSRIMHHAVAAGDVDAVVRHGPAAAAEASRAGSHREAAAHLRLVTGHLERFEPAAGADLLERYAVECYLLGRADRAAEVQGRAAELRRSLGDRRAYGTSLRWLSRMHWWAGSRPAAEAAAAEAIAVLETAGDDRLLARALSNLSQLHFLAGRGDDAVSVGSRAIELARAVGDAETISHALNNIGIARWQHGEPHGRSAVEEALRVALAAGEDEHACRAYVNLVWGLMDDLELGTADRLLAEAMEVAERSEQFGFLQYMVVELAMLRLAQGRWDEAAEAAALGADGRPPVSAPSLTVLGLVRARRGLPDAAELLERAWECAVDIGEAQRIGPTGTARAEAAWLRGDAAGSRLAAAAALDVVAAHGAVRMRAELAPWVDAAGRAALAPPADHPCVLLADGDWAAAAERWAAAGYPYEHAVALAASPEPEDRLAALAILDGLGAEPMARRVRAGLRALGVTRIPRGPRGGTRSNPAGLTERQLEILRLVAGGLTNAEIAARLVVSVRTVDNHVAAILEKLDARTRREAATKAAELGVVGDP
jgi:DNA-binding NarL/FixJ family response regulator/tetratricopeptide (TPR) repeat protein